MDETYEQFEERVLNKRAAHMYHAIKSKLDAKDRLTLSEMAYKNNRKQVSFNIKSKIFLSFMLRYFIVAFLLILGGAKVLHIAGPQEVPSVGIASGVLVRGHHGYQRSQVRESFVIRCINVKEKKNLNCMSQNTHTHTPGGW